MSYPSGTRHEQRLVQHLRITAIMDDERELRRPDRSTCRVDPVDTARSHVHDRAAVCAQDVKSDRVAPDRPFGFVRLGATSLFRSKTTRSPSSERATASARLEISSSAPVGRSAVQRHFRNER